MSDAALRNALRCRRTVSVCASISLFGLRRAKRGRFAYLTFILTPVRGRRSARCAHFSPGVPSPKSLGLRCEQNGPPARREEGAYLKRYVTDEQTQPPAHFHRNPLGRGRLAVFPRCSLLTYRSGYARRSRLEKQPTCGETQGI
jgi:hypothetical protein